MAKEIHLIRRVIPARVKNKSQEARKLSQASTQNASSCLVEDEVGRDPEARE
jgi:hypothetical protein